MMHHALMFLAIVTASFTASFTTVASSSLAGQMTVKGTSKLGHKAEFISLTVTVDSQCYPSQDALLKATNGAAEKIKNAMQTFINVAADSRDQILALPGYTTRSTLRIFDPATNRHTVICENGWHAKNTVVLKIANYEVWPDLQQSILAIADTYAQSGSEVATTNVTLQAPIPQLYDTTIKALQAQAQRQALASASAQFKEIAKQCGLYNHRIVSLQAETPAPIYARAARLASDENSDPDDFNPEYDQIYIEANWVIVWEFVDNGEGCVASLLNAREAN